MTENITRDTKKMHENSQENMKLKRFKEGKSLTFRLWHDLRLPGLHGGRGGSQQVAKGGSVRPRPGGGCLKEVSVTASEAESHSLCSCITPHAQPAATFAPGITDLVPSPNPRLGPDALRSVQVTMWPACTLSSFRSHLRSHHLPDSSPVPPSKGSPEYLGFC